MTSTPRRFGIALAAALVAVALFGQSRLSAAPVEVNGRVAKITLYRGQALVTRDITLEAGPGSREVVVGNLPEQTVADSLFAEAGAEVEIRAVRFRSRAVSDEPRDEVRKLDEAIQGVEDKIALNSKQSDVLKKRDDFLDQLEGFVAPTAKAELTKGVLDAAQLEKITTFSFGQRAANAEEHVQLAKEARALSEELALLQKRRAELTKGSTRSIREAVLFLEKRADAAADVRLNYLVNGCGWMPTYTMRADNGNQVRVEYNALIQQMTGEDWTDVELNLSTASPALSSAGPGLAPFHIALRENGQQPQQQAGQAGQADLGQQLKSIISRQNLALMQNSAASDLQRNFDTSWSLNDAANAFQQFELANGKDLINMLKVGEVAQDEPSLSYQLGGKVSLASRSDQQMVRIMQTELESRFYHIATPVLTSYVYREAELINRSEHDLLGGPITVYLAGRFVGRTEIPTVARGETFVVGFGADPQLRVRRELADRSEGVQGGNRELSFQYRLVIENFKEQPAALRVFARLPHSEREMDLRVTLGQTKDELSTDPVYLRRERPKGILRWDIEVPALAMGEKARMIDYNYSVEFDRKFDLTAAAGGTRQQDEFEQLQRGRLKF